ncbi:hypothetical protein WM23_07670 [Burkholderia ubonensis]|nr:hypothetical protein WM23_07670 [Burkholderia ubonensis]
MEVKLNATWNEGALAVQHYFVNGGGMCYILPVDPAIDAQLDALPSEIAKYPDISLLVCPQTDHTLGGKKAAIYAQLNHLLAQPEGYFLIADSVDGKTRPSTEQSQTAVYFPDLVTSLKPARPLDTAIAVTDHPKAEVVTLAILAQHDREAYAGISEQIDRFLARASVVLPPSAAVAGAYARTDRERGVWKAPANVGLAGVESLQERVSDTEQGDMNLKGINVIRTFPEHRALIWGARTLAVQDDDWRYIPVRRLFNTAGREIKAALRMAVFEPNGEATWTQVKTAIEGYLTRLWRQGALAGNSAKEAFFVKVGQGITMDDDDIRNGRLIIQVGLAAVRPAEFIIVQFTQELPQA